MPRPPLKSQRVIPAAGSKASTREVAKNRCNSAAMAFAEMAYAESTGHGKRPSELHPLPADAAEACPLEEAMISPRP
jgi:hypothetical protein